VTQLNNRYPRAFPGPGHNGPRLPALFRLWRRLRQLRIGMGLQIRIDVLGHHELAHIDSSGRGRCRGTRSRLPSSGAMSLRAWRWPGSTSLVAAMMSEVVGMKARPWESNWSGRMVAVAAPTSGRVPGFDHHEVVGHEIAVLEDHFERLAFLHHQPGRGHTSSARGGCSPHTRRRAGSSILRGEQKPAGRAGAGQLVGDLHGFHVVDIRAVAGGTFLAQATRALAAAAAFLGRLRERGSERSP